MFNAKQDFKQILVNNLVILFVTKFINMVVKIVLRGT